LVTVVTESEIEIDKDVTLDGEGYLTVALPVVGSEDRAVFVVPEGVAADLGGITVGAASFEHNPLGVLNLGMLTLADSVVANGDEVGIHNVGTLTITNSIVWKNGGICDDGDLCTDDKCDPVKRMCVYSKSRCFDRKCQYGSCDPADGSCHYTNKPDGTDCGCLREECCDIFCISRCCAAYGCCRNGSCVPCR
jgi:hypothetical protein